MGTAPSLLVLVGIIEIIIAASVRGDRSIRRFVVGGLLVCGLSIISIAEVTTKIGDHLCD
jgi:hypothetical protein